MGSFEKAMHDPSSVFLYPMQVVEDRTLTREQKIRILRQWEYDARELGVADEENMCLSPTDTENPPGNVLKLVLEALHCLGQKAA